MAGWIKTHRAIQSHWVFSDAEKFRAWMIILFTVNFEPKKQLIEGELIECERGQSIYSLNSWAGKFGKKWSVQKVRTFFDLLKKDKMITTEGLRKTTRLTVCNYETYQDEQQTDNKQVTQRQQTGNKEVTTTKEGKESKEVKNDKKGNRAKRFLPPTPEEIKAYCIERKNNVDPIKFFNHYEANGWMRGKTKITKWKACVITWENNDKSNKDQPKSKIGKTMQSAKEAYEIIKNTEIDLS